MVSRLKATVVEGVLSIFGRADERVFGQSVWVEVFEDGRVVVEDRSGRNVTISVLSDGSTITSAVLSGIHNAGVFFRSTLPSVTSVVGTGRDDLLVISVADGSFLIKGGEGDDQLRSFGSGRLLGQMGHDQIDLGNGAAVAWGGGKR